MTFSRPLLHEYSVLLMISFGEREGCQGPDFEPHEIVPLTKNQGTHVPRSPHEHYSFELDDPSELSPLPSPDQLLISSSVFS